MNDEYVVLRDRLADEMRSAHSSGDTVSSPTDAADYALAFLLTHEGWGMLEAAYSGNPFHEPDNERGIWCCIDHETAFREGTLYPHAPGKWTDG